MDYTQFMRTLERPYWVDNPLAWESGLSGIAFLAREGRVGMFNLCLLAVNSYEPPPPEGYRTAPLPWVLQSGAAYELHGATLEHHASLKPLSDFCKLIGKPPASATHIVSILFAAGLKRLAYDIRHRRAA